MRGQIEKQRAAPSPGPVCEAHGIGAGVSATLSRCQCSQNTPHARGRKTKMEESWVAVVDKYNPSSGAINCGLSASDCLLKQV